MSLFKSHWEKTYKEETGRLRKLGMVFSLLLLVVLFRASQFQVWKRDPWREMAPRQYKARVKLQAVRGVIYDRDMNILAMDLPISCVAVDPSEIKDVHAVTAFLSQTLGVTIDSCQRLIESNKTRHFVWIQKDISDDQYDAFLRKEMPGVIPIQGRKRVNPYQKVAYQVLGLTNVEHGGVGGIEQAFDNRLRGEDGWAIYQRDGNKRNYSSLDYPIKACQNGHHVVTTLDHAYQTIVEEELKRGVKNHNAKHGSVVLLDPFTGEILAMASVVKNQNKGQSADFNYQLQNKAVQVDFEPGSIFKIVTAAAALEEGYYTPTSLIHCENGKYKLASHVIHDHDKAYDWLTLGQVLENSSNIGMAKIGRKLGREIVCRYTQNFGFGNKSGVGLPGEIAGIIPPAYRWTDFSTAMASFGQGISTTAIQIASMVSVIANGGELIRPRIVSAILDEEGKEIEQYQREIIRRVVKKNTADQLRTILEAVVENGTGKEAGVEGVRIAGKTGTAQKSVPGYKGYLPGAYVSSFVGFWPVDTPMFVMVVVLDEPRQMYWGAQSAGPVFSRIVERISGMGTKSMRFQNENNKRFNRNTFVLSSFDGENKEPGFEPQDQVPKQESPYHIPALVGLSVREALQKMAKRKIVVKIQGGGVVVRQEPKQGTKVENNMICQLFCKENK